MTLTGSDKRGTKLAVTDRRAMRLAVGDRLAPLLVTLGGALLLPALQLAGAFAPQVELDGSVALPELQVQGSFSPQVALGGNLALPALQVSGAIAPTVELGGSLVVPALQLSGSFGPVVQLEGAVGLPALQLAGVLTPAVELTGTPALPSAGALALPSLLLAGTIAPAVAALSGALVLPSLQLAGAVAPTVGTLAGSLALPSVQLGGAFTLALTGALVLPQLQLGGSFAPAVALAGALTVPQVQLGGSVAPVVSVGGNLLLPSLQITGGITTSPSKVTALLSLEASAQSGGEWTNWVDLLNNNPGTSNAARRPAVGAAANGLPIAIFSTNDCVSVPLIPNNNQTTKVGWAFWLKPSNFPNTTCLMTIGSGTGGASALKHRLLATPGRNLRIDAFISGSNGRQFIATASLPLSVWSWVRLRYDSSLGGDANLAVYLNDTIVSAGTWSNIGAGGTLGTLPVVTGNLLIGNVFNDVTPSSPLEGSIGPLIWFFNDEPGAAEEAAIMAYKRPT
jgi:hypothetical protein